MTGLIAKPYNLKELPVSILSVLFGKRKPQNSARRISKVSRRAVMRRLRTLYKKVERKDVAIAGISQEISRLATRRFARATKRMKDRTKANLLSDRDVLLAEVAALEAQLNSYNAKNLSLAKKH